MTALRVILLAAVLAAPSQRLLAQGQDAQTSAMAPQTNPRPPALSSASVTGVPGGTRIAPVAGITVPRPADRGDAVVPPGLVELRAPSARFCAEVRDGNARRACEAAKPEPPRGGGGGGR